MYKEITTQQLTEAAQTMLTTRLHTNTPPNQLNLNFHPVLEYCDGPAHIVAFRFHTYPWMANPANMTHGGMIAALFDNSMGMTCSALYNAITPTISMTINYARPVPLDIDVVIRVHAVSTGGTTAQLTAEMYRPEEPNALLATASGAYFTARVPKDNSPLV